jgi:hypothetical protein
MNGRTNESSVTRRQVKQISEPARACIVSGLRHGSGLGLLARATCIVGPPSTIGRIDPVDKFSLHLCNPFPGLQQ